MKIRALAALLIAGQANAQSFPVKYDDDIRSASKKWLPLWHWHQLKAQYVQESQLNPNAISPVGAEGIAQFMPGTWGDVSRAMKWGIVPRSAAKYSIEGGAYYMSTLRRNWSADRPEHDRWELSLASYNAGLGSILKAQNKCAGARHWPQISPCLRNVTGERNARETTTYVVRINRLSALMGTN